MKTIKEEIKKYQRRNKNYQRRNKNYQRIDFIFND